MNRTPCICRSERGAVFVQIAIAIFVLMAFNVFVLDYGIMWIGRRQAQNAADAGALAGAVARGYDDFDDPPLSGGRAERSAEGVARANLIWQQAGVPEVLFECPAGVTGKCVRVNVYRNAENGNPLPTFFGPILGITSQGVRATATAIAGNGNATECLRPFAFPDKWVENRPPGDEFNRYLVPGPGTPLSPADQYIPPDGTQAVSYNITDFGHRIDFQYNQLPTDPITEGLLLSLNLPGSNTYEENIAGCNGQPVALHASVPLRGGPPGTTTRTALQALFAQDSGATWNSVDQRVENSCAPGCAPVSPRLIAIALFDPDRYQLARATGDWSACPGGTPCIRVSNIIGFFIHLLNGGSGGHGHFVRYAGMSVTDAPTFVDDGSWLVTTNLIR